MTLTKEIFESQIRGLASFIGCDLPTNLQAAIYWDKFKGITDKRFCKLVKRLYDTWKYRHFPLLGDFNTAFNETSEGQREYQPEPREPLNQTLKSKAFKRVHEGLKMLDKLEREVTKKKMGNKFYSDVPRRISLSYWIPFIKQVLRAGMVYQGGKWLKKSEAKGEHFDPREFYPPEYYK